MTWQLYLVQFETRGNLIPYYTYGNKYLDLPIIGQQLIPLGKTSITLPEKTFLPIKVGNEAFTLFLDKCRYSREKASVRLHLSSEEDLELEEVLLHGIDTIKFRATVLDGQLTTGHLSIYFTDEHHKSNYRLCWWNTKFGPFPVPVPATVPSPESS